MTLYVISYDDLGCTKGGAGSGPGLHDQLQYNVSYMDYIVERICLLWIGPSIPFV